MAAFNRGVTKVNDPTSDSNRSREESQEHKASKDGRDTSITPEMSKRICSHMNTDHSATVYAMALSTLSSEEEHRAKISQHKMTSVNLDNYILSFILCMDGYCETRKVVVQFVPPMTCARESRPRLIEEHHKVLAPKLSWLVTDPFMRIILPTCFALAYATHISGTSALIDYIQNNDTISSIIRSIFGSPSNFAMLVQYSWYFSAIAHSLEAVIVAYLCKMRLKMKFGNVLKWFGIVCCVGYPATKKVLKLVEIDIADKAKRT